MIYCSNFDDWYNSVCCFTVTWFLGLIIFEYTFMESYGTYATGPIYDPIHYFYKYKRALVFYKTMLIKRQRVLLVSSIGITFTNFRPIFTFIFNIGLWSAVHFTNYRKVSKKIKYTLVLLDVLYYPLKAHIKNLY